MFKFENGPLFIDLDNDYREIQVDIEKIRSDILTDIEREIIADEINVLLDELTRWKADIELIKAFQFNWLACGEFFDDSTVQVKFMEENKKFRDIDRFSNKVIQHAQENAYIRKVLEKMNKTDKKQRNSDMEQIKIYIVALEDYNKKISEWFEEQKQNRVNKKLYQFKIDIVSIYDHTEIVYVCSRITEDEIDEKNIDDEIFSESGDDLF